MENLYFKDGLISQKSTRFRINCLYCPALQIDPKKRKYIFHCLFYKIKLTWSNYNMYANHFTRFEKEQCPVIQINN